MMLCRKRVKLMESSRVLIKSHTNSFKNTYSKVIFCTKLRFCRIKFKLESFSTKNETNGNGFDSFCWEKT